MKLEFDNIIIQDFKEIRKHQELKLSKLGLGVHFVAGLNLVEPELGSNGASKSSIWDALCWCLFGRTVRGLRGSDIRTWGSKAQAIVEVWVTVKDIQHSIKRSTATNGLWIDDAVVEQAEIDKLLGLSYATFPHTILLGQGEPLFFDLEARNKLALLSETLDLDRWERYSKRARAAVIDLDSTWQKLDGQKGELERTRVEAEAALYSLRHKASAWETERQDRDNNREKQLASLRKALSAAQKLKGDHDLKLESAETEARATRKRKAALEAAYNESMATLGAISAATRVLIEERDRWKNAGSIETCPTCGQSLKGASHAKHKADAKKRLASIETDLETNRGMIRDLTKANDRDRATVTKLARELASFEEAADDARDGYTRADLACADASAKIKAIEAQGETDLNEPNPYNGLVKKARSTMSKLKETIEECQRLQDAAERKRTRTAYWVKGFKDVRLYLLEEMLDELEGVAATILPQFGLEGWTIGFAMEKESAKGIVSPGLNVTIRKPGLAKGVKWESWSGGEGQRLRLIGAIALSEVLLRRAGVECDLLILDEPTAHLSPQGVRDTIDVLIDLGQDRQVFYCDHTAPKSNRFTSTILVTRDKAGARIEVEQ